MPLYITQGQTWDRGRIPSSRKLRQKRFNLPIDKVELVVSDTALTGNSGSASASRMTFMAGNSIRGAADLALEKWKNEERPVKATYQYRPPKTTPLDPQTGKSEPNFAYGYVAEAVEVEVDTGTGEIRIKKVICSDDVGKAINPQQVAGKLKVPLYRLPGMRSWKTFVQQDGTY